MTVCVSSHLNAPADSVWRTVKKSATLIFVTRGLLGFSRGAFPSEWRAGETVVTRLWLFNLIPAWTHVLHFARVDDEQQEILTNERGGLVNVWNHSITVRHKSEKSCLYTDKIEIEAGLATVLVWLFAQIFYRYRHLRWRRLASQINTLEL